MNLEASKSAEDLRERLEDLRDELLANADIVVENGVGLEPWLG